MGLGPESNFRVLKLFSSLRCSRSSENETKRWGMMLFANHLFKVYFKMSQLHLMKPLIRAIESSPLKSRFSIGQQVTYKYYAGLKAMMDEDYKSGTCILQNSPRNLILNDHYSCINIYVYNEL